MSYPEATMEPGEEGQLWHLVAEPLQTMQLQALHLGQRAGSLRPPASAHEEITEWLVVKALCGIW